jgi:hypothetical protein
MKKLIGLLLVALLFILGCVTNDSFESNLLSMMEGQLNGNTLVLDDKVYAGPKWVPVDKNGNTWELVTNGHRIGTDLIIAKCEYTYMKVRGIRLWRGVYYMGVTDFFGGGFDKDFKRGDDLEELHGCVEWVNKQLLGDYYF